MECFRDKYCADDQNRVFFAGRLKTASQTHIRKPRDFILQFIQAKHIVIQQKSKVCFNKRPYWKFISKNSGSLLNISCDQNPLV